MGICANWIPGYLPTLRANRKFVLRQRSRFREEEIPLVPEGEIATKRSRGGESHDDGLRVT